MKQCLDTIAARFFMALCWGGDLLGESAGAVQCKMSSSPHGQFVLPSLCRLAIFPLAFGSIELVCGLEPFWLSVLRCLPSVKLASLSTTETKTQKQNKQPLPENATKTLPVSNWPSGPARACSHARLPRLPCPSQKLMTYSDLHQIRMISTAEAPEHRH